MMTVMQHGAEPNVNLDSVTSLADAWQVAETLAQSDLVPVALRNKPANVLLVYLTGREMGLSFAQAIRTVYIAPGGQPQLRGSLLLAKLHEHGHTYRWSYSEDGNECTFYIKRGGKDPEYSASFGLDDALAAGLCKRAQNGEIVAYSQSNKPLPWMQYRQDMLFWRAVARTVNRAAPEVILGFEIMGAGEVQQAEVVLEPQAPPASTPAEEPPAQQQQAAVTEELAALDTQGAKGGQQPDAPKANRSQLKSVVDHFAAMGWTREQHQQQILAACTAWCRRPIRTAADLTSSEATGLAAALGRLEAKHNPDHHPVAMAEAEESWRQAWAKADPAGYDSICDSREDAG